ncbi:MAG: RNA 2',3'-cyclic phosphodiesterase [bacterium]|nr:RNA 2',3'-cyclic phosphodiesterase [bacterium]
MRAFVAIKIPTEIIEKVAQLQESLKEVQGVKWVKPENIHLTLKFLGEVKDEQIETVKSAIKSSIQGIKPFNISLSDIGGFPNLRRPNVLWIGVKEGKDKLIGLINKLEKELSKLGFEPEAREPSPHLTIGRIKKGQKPEIKNQKFETSAFTPPLIKKEAGFIADKVYLIKSTLTPEAPVYTDIAEFKF